MKFSVLTLVFCCASVITHAQYTNLVLEGGGMKGIAYAGAFEVLDSIGITDSIQQVAGSSAGAMNGLMYALGYTGKEIRYLNEHTNFAKYSQVGVPIISGFIRLKRTYGYYKSDRMIEDLAKIMQQKGFSRDMTFEELYTAKQAGLNVKLLYITGSNLTDQKIEIFSHETYPKMRITDAVRISVNIPVYFEALFMQPDGSLVEKKEADSTTKVMVDGGILDNYPFYIFDTLVTTPDGNSYYKCNKNTLGIKLETDSSSVRIAPKTITKASDFMHAYGKLGSEYLNRRHLGPQQKIQTIYINTHNFDPKIKRQTRDSKVQLMNYGKEAAKEYFLGR